MHGVGKQLDFDLFDTSGGTHSPVVVAAIERLATALGTESRGVIFTRPEVVDFILGLVGYTEDQPLHKKRLLEPSFGAGDFLLPVVGRLLKAWGSSPHTKTVIEELGDAIRAVELHRETFSATRFTLIERLKQERIEDQSAVALVDRWLVQEDFLLTPLEMQFDFVVGNPPFVRPEMIPAPLLVEYRGRYQTMYDRADLYIPFIERSLSLLAPIGSLGFICADRWMKNRYGAPLRNLVADQFHLKIYVDMVDTPAFHSDLIAYPAITVISREAPGPTRFAHRPAINRIALGGLADALRA